MATSYDWTTRVNQIVDQLERPYQQVLNQEFSFQPADACGILHRQVTKGIGLLQKVSASGTQDSAWIQTTGTSLWNKYLTEANKIQTYALNNGFSVGDYPTDVPEDLLKLCGACEEPIEEALSVSEAFPHEIPPYQDGEFEPPKGPSF